MHESSVFAGDLTAARTAWTLRPLCFEQALSQDYHELLPDEGLTENARPPSAFERAIQARLHPPMAPGEAARLFGGGGGIRGHELQIPPNISLHSPVLLVFF